MKQFYSTVLVCVLSYLYSVSASQNQKQTDPFLTQIQKIKGSLNTDIDTVKKQLIAFRDTAAKIFPSQQAADIQVRLQTLAQEADVFQQDMHTQLAAISQKYEEYRKSNAQGNQERALISQLAALGNQKQEKLQKWYKQFAIYQGQFAQQEALYNKTRIAEKKRQAYQEQQASSAFIAQLLPRIYTIDQQAQKCMQEYVKTKKLDAVTIGTILQEYQGILSSIKQQQEQLLFQENIHNISALLAMVIQKMVDCIRNDVRITLMHLRFFEREGSLTGVTIKNYILVIQSFNVRMSNNVGNYMSYKAVLNLIDTFGKAASDIVSRLYKRLSMVVVPEYITVLRNIASLAGSIDEQYIEFSQQLEQEIREYGKIGTIQQIIDSAKIAAAYVGHIALRLCMHILDGMNPSELNEPQRTEAIRMAQIAQQYYTTADEQLLLQRATIQLNSLVGAASSLQHAQELAGSSPEEAIKAYQKAYVYAMQAEDMCGAYYALVQKQQLEILLRGVTPTAQHAQTVDDISFVQSVVKQYDEAIIPNKKVSKNIPFQAILGMPVPYYFELQRYTLKVPAAIVTNENITKNEAKYLRNDPAVLITLLKSIYMYNALAENGITQLASAQVEVMQTGIQDSVNRAIELIRSRIAQKKSAIRFVAEHDTYSLVIENQPIPPTPDIFNLLCQAPFKGFPSALSYLQWVERLTDPKKDMVLYGTKMIKSLQSVPLHQQARERIKQVYLSAASYLHAKARYMAGLSINPVQKELIAHAEKDILEKTAQKVLQLKANKRVALTKDAQKMMTIIRQYMLDGALSYVQYAEGYASNNQNIAAFKIVSGQVYEDMATIGKSLLVGDPADTEYFFIDSMGATGMFADVVRNYMNAYTLNEQKEGILKQDVILLCLNNGNTLFDQGEYVSALSYYKYALTFIDLTNDSHKKFFEEIALQTIRSAARSGEQAIKEFALFFKKPYKLNNSTEKSHSISIGKLVSHIGYCPNSEVDPDLCVIYNACKESFMKVFVYLSDIRDWLSSLSALSGLKSGENALSAHELFSKETVAAFSITTVAGAERLIRSADFLSVFAQPFKQIEEYAKKGGSMRRTLKPLDQAIGSLLNMVQQLYGVYFLPGLSPAEQEEQVRKLITIYKSSTVASFADWFGINAFQQNSNH